MPATRDLDPTASPGHFFGAEVRRARVASGWTLADLAATVPCDASTVSRIEAGTLSPGERFAAACDEAFPAMGGWFARFYHDSRTWAGPHPPWFRDWVETERRATVIRWWEPLLIPGLLQTEGYARAVLGWGPDDGRDLDERVAARLERQGIFGRDVPPEVWILIGEPVLGYCVGSADIMRKQLEYLAEMAARPRVTIQVISASAGAYGGLSGAFAIGTDSTADSVVYLETGIQGMVVRDPRLITRAVSVFDHLRAEALPRSQTLDILAKAGEKWNG
jgi:transcriptional regulator with XRE-family HTH domain